MKRPMMFLGVVLIGWILMNLVGAVVPRSWAATDRLISGSFNSHSSRIRDQKIYLTPNLTSPPDILFGVNLKNPLDDDNNPDARLITWLGRRPANTVTYTYKKVSDIVQELGGAEYDHFGDFHVNVVPTSPQTVWMAFNGGPPGAEGTAHVMRSLDGGQT